MKTTIEIPANRKTRRSLKDDTMKVSNESTNTVTEYKFVPMKSKVTQNHNDWTFTKMHQSFGNKTVNDKPKYQRPDVDGTRLLFGEGNEWQQNLMKDILIGNPFQPIHLRLNNGIWEIVDGGHRTRTVYKFLNGYIRLPEGTILTDENGKEFDLSNKTFKDIIVDYSFLETYIWNLKFEVYEYRDITNIQAEELFLKLNDLHDMSHADKRNAIDNIVADICRDKGAVDSKHAISIFKEVLTNSKGKTLANVSIPITKRATDEMISFALYYLYKGGIFTDGFIGLESQPALNDMYRDKTLIKRLTDENDSLSSDFDKLLTILNDVIKCGRLSDKRNGLWKKGSIKKLIMLIVESAKSAGGFSKYNPNAKKFYKELKQAYTELLKSKVKHNPYQLYKLDNGKVVPLPKSEQPTNVRYHETHMFPSVFTGGARVDDLQYIYYHFLTKGSSTFGLKTNSKDDVRTFNQKQFDILWAEQGGKCKKTGVDLNETEYAVDHILPYSFGGPTDVKNGQILSKSANDMKSSGMDIDDVKYLCEKYGYEDFDGLSKYILKGSITLSESQIKDVKQMIIG
ncbi:hypothetical protein N9I13_00250 [bacterium]|nr:hypothetical protein [bacterium]